MLPLKVDIFSEQGDHTPIKIDVPSNPAFKRASRFLAEKIQSPKLLQSRLNHYSKFSHVSPNPLPPVIRKASRKLCPHFQKMGCGYLLSFKGVQLQIVIGHNKNKS